MKTISIIILTVALLIISLGGIWRDHHEREATSSPEAIAKLAEAIDNHTKNNRKIKILAVTNPIWDLAVWGQLSSSNITFWTDQRWAPVDALNYDELIIAGLHDRSADIITEFTGLYQTDRARTLWQDENSILKVFPRDTSHSRLIKSLSDDFQHLNVWRGSPQKPNECKRRGNRFACGTSSWEDVYLTKNNVFHQDVEWLWTHPGPLGTELKLRWSKLTCQPQQPCYVLVRFGFHIDAIRRDEGKDVIIEIMRDGQSVYKKQLLPHRYDVERVLVNITNSSEQALEFRIYSEIDHHWRQAMLEADLIENPGEAIQADTTAIID